MSSAISYGSAANRPPLRLYSADQLPEESGPHPPQISTDSRLSEVFEMGFIPRWIKPKLIDEKTVKLYRDALKYWLLLTGDPPIAQIDEWTTSHFVEQLLEQPGRKSEFLSICTVRKHCTQINKLLDFCGPVSRDKHRRKNLSLLALPPWVDSPSPDEDPPDGDFTIDEVRSIYAAAERMTVPRQVVGCSVGRFFQVLIIVACYTGLRIGQIMHLEYGNLRPPHILVMAKGSKRRKGKKQYLAAEALQEIESIRSPRSRIFDLPNWESNPRWLQTCFERLLVLAGLPAERQFGFHGFRKLHATLIAAGDAHGGIRTAQYSLGHDEDSTTRGHYINGRVQEQLVAQAIERLPSPKPKRKPEDPRQTHIEFA